MTAEPIVFQSAPIITIGYLMQVIFSLAIVVGLIYLAARFIFPRLKTTATGRLIKVIDRAYLDPQLTAYVIKAGKAAWLVVGGARGVAAVGQVEEESEPK